MLEREILKYSLNEVKTKVDKCEVSLTQNNKYELNLESGEISLLRTTIENVLAITVLKDHKKGSITINKTDKASINEAISNVIEICDNSEPDDAFDIAPYQERNEFKTGDEEPDLDRMYDLLIKYVETVNETYPTINLMDTFIAFNHKTRYFMNSNGVDFKDTKGMYQFVSMFAAKEGSKSSSFNMSEFTIDKLEKDILSYGTVNTILQQTTEQTETQTIDGKFKGDVIISPDCLETMISFYVGCYLTDVPLISGTSLLKDKLNEKVASSLLTLHSKPTTIKNGYHVTSDGFLAEDATIIENGKLNNYLLSIYGANKTGYQKVNTGGAYVVEPGDKTFEEMVKSIDKGVLVCRVSGGHPNNNGDLSVVIKNSYYIENGEIKFPLNDAMITTNLEEAFNNITEISKETIDFGSRIFPYVKMKDVLISGK